MTLKRTPRPRDPIQLGKLMVDIVTGAVPDMAENGASGRAAGGIKGGVARAAKLTEEQRAEIARVGADARWKRSRP